MDKKKHFYRMGNHSGGWDDLPVDSDELDVLINSARKHIEPWLSAVFQAEHLNLLLGSGFTTAVGYIAGAPSTGMAKVTFGTTYDAAIDMSWPGLSGQDSGLAKWNSAGCRSGVPLSGWHAGRAEPDRSDAPTTAAKFMLPRPAAGGQSRRDPASGRQGSNAGACGCKSQNIGRARRGPRRRCRRP